MNILSKLKDMVSVPGKKTEIEENDIYGGNGESIDDIYDGQQLSDPLSGQGQYTNVYGGQQQMNPGLYNTNNQNYNQPNYRGGASPEISINSDPNVDFNSVEIKVVKPTNFDAALEIADFLVRRKTVVLNLEETNRETARRLIDFLDGVAYAIDGTLKRTGNFMFIITPSNISISGEQLKNEKQNDSGNTNNNII